MNEDTCRKVLCVGECMVEFLRADSRDGNMWRQGFAGDTLNVAWALRACLNAPLFEVDYLTTVGDDDFSSEMLKFLRDAGIGTSGIGRLNNMACGLYTISVDEEGERSFNYWRSTSAARHLADDTDHLEKCVESAELVYVSGITLAILPPDRREALLRVLGAPGERDHMVAFDSNMRPALWENNHAMCAMIERMSAISDIVLPTYDDEKAAFQDDTPESTLERYEALGCGEIIVKNGREPTLYSSGGARGEAGVETPVHPVDTTGAGDSFSGTYLAARLQGDSIVQAISKAQRVAALVITVKGALAPMAYIADICQRQ